MMEIKILKDAQNLLLERREVEFQVIHAGKPTPSKHDMAEKLAAKLNAKLDLMLIENYTTSFGMNTSEGRCIVYENKDAMINAESTRLMNPKKRIGLVEKKETPKEPAEEKIKAAEEKPKDEVKPKEEKPKKEEKKDEAQAEQKK